MTIGTQLAIAIGGNMWTLTVCESLQDENTVNTFASKADALAYVADNWEPSADMVEALDRTGQFAEDDHGISVSVTLLGPEDAL